ncbi:MAG: hypothetical protein DBY32_11720 [Phascolarctobacterium sp.]|nr:MAG: hypothetical protein DBY32_11720 [Phascolarctobacterium sp.]
MFDKVLLATDLSEEADGLLNCFYSLCPEVDTEIAVAHVFKDKSDAEPGSSSFKKVQSRVRALVAELRRAGYEEAREIYRSGEVFEELTDVAEKEDAGLIMVASHGKGFFKSALLGSTTFDLARATDRPLFVSKPVENDAEEMLQRNLLHRILVPTDFSLKSLSALDVIRMLREHITEVIFVHVVERSRSQEDLEDKIRTAGRRLQELVDEIKIFGIKAAYHVRKGAASKEILRLAEKEDVSLIVMAKTGAGLVKGLVMGSTAQNVTLNAERSLLLLPPENAAEE